MNLDTLVCRINSHRSAEGVAPLAISDALSSVAQTHTEYMARIDALSAEGEAGSSLLDHALAALPDINLTSGCGLNWKVPGDDPEAVAAEWARDLIYLTDASYNIVGVGHSGDYWTALCHQAEPMPTVRQPDC
ncbi:CAP domain-containing protein [Streptomyces tanashiensis]|uniref:CAP domain-containing protein n=1 Tax=Streptomyces tanashiensis TaxID=67367 RepID=UPI00341F2D0C